MLRATEHNIRMVDNSIKKRQEMIDRVKNLSIGLEQKEIMLEIVKEVFQEINPWR